MNGFAPGLDRRPVEWVDKAANPSKCLAALFLILERFFSKNCNGREAILGLSRLDYPLAKTGVTGSAVFATCLYQVLAFG